MKKWTEAQARAENITDYEQFNKEYNAHKGTINGGIDRSMLPQDTIAKGYVVDKAFHKVHVNEYNEFPSSTSQYYDTGSATGAKEVRGLSYSTYSGGYIEILSQEYTDLKDGMVQIEFSAHLKLDVTFSVAAGGQHNKGAKIALEWNGVQLLETFYFTQPIQTIRVTAHTFTAGGTNTLKVKALCSPKGTTDWLHKSQMHFYNMRTMIIGRWR